MTRKTLLAVALAAGALVVPGQAAAQDRSCVPSIRDLGTLGGDSSDVGDMSRSGWIAGRSADASGVPRAVLWRGGTTTRIAIPGPADQASNAIAVNDGGAAAVNAGVLGDISHLRTWVWRRGRATLLPALPGGGGTAARRINDHGDVVGNAIAADGHTHPVLWHHGQITDLGLPAGMTDGFAFGINDAGEISGSVATSPDDDGELFAFTWRDGDFRILDHGQANVIDDSGRAAGRFDDSAGLPTAAWWAPDGTLHDLGVLDPHSSDPLGWIFATDGRGDWAGAGSGDDGTPTAFVSRLHGPLLALPGLDGTYTSESYAHGLDPSGDAAGQSTTIEGQLHATLWTCAFVQARAPGTVARGLG